MPRAEVLGGRIAAGGEKGADPEPEPTGTPSHPRPLTLPELVAAVEQPAPLLVGASNITSGASDRNWVLAVVSGVVALLALVFLPTAWRHAPGYGAVLRQPRPQAMTAAPLRRGRTRARMRARWSAGLQNGPLRR